ncbi:MAG: hypothetical protein M1818_007472 [Claussenomyces sp. TS43310]|nr:MAG: hypothetical protein M1818_007472 [Claussenomyces sp. TS43310]
MSQPEIRDPEMADAEDIRYTQEDSLECEKADYDKFTEDCAHRSISSSEDDGRGGQSSIVHHYLTFETDFPAPARPRRDAAAAPPPEPDLTPYISPFLWSRRRKDFIIYLSCLATALTAYTAGSYSPPAAAMAREWHVSREAVLVGILTFCVGFALAPMALAPFSEINGRYPVFVAAGILFVICQICCAVARSYAGMLVARFFVGCGSSVFSTMVGGVVSDLYHAEERNLPMALFSGAVLVGTGLIITCGLMVLAVTVFFRETRGSVLLSRKAQCLNKWYEEREEAGYVGFLMPLGDGKAEVQRIRWKVKSDEERESLSKMIKISIGRPFCES